ncbi:MAG: hypothetical protein II847_07490 [Ruminobacter sp.]|uniref:hypothetical protein n=1 Tax=Ruminobacter sp. TaxID=2774296 RepID=UPI00257DCEC3|nr:hypothetical protein [Ruminobacter sp.]MBQ3775955.1 hypothetical protein [Ruminobacter sp.]
MLIEVTCPKCQTKKDNTVEIFGDKNPLGNPVVTCSKCGNVFAADGVREAVNGGVREYDLIRRKTGLTIWGVGFTLVFMFLMVVYIVVRFHSCDFRILVAIAIVVPGGAYLAGCLRRYRNYYALPGKMILAESGRRMHNVAHLKILDKSGVFIPEYYRDILNRWSSCLFRQGQRPEKAGGRDSAEAESAEKESQNPKVIDRCHEGVCWYCGNEINPDREMHIGPAIRECPQCHKYNYDENAVELAYRTTGNPKEKYEQVMTVFKNRVRPVDDTVMGLAFITVLDAAMLILFVWADIGFFADAIGWFFAVMTVPLIATLVYKIRESNEMHAEYPRFNTFSKLMEASENRLSNPEYVRHLDELSVNKDDDMLNSLEERLKQYL